ncbi:MAG: Gfo/Idh/MocA family protein [Chthoniobacteraceae bacterium]
MNRRTFLSVTGAALVGAQLSSSGRLIYKRRAAVIGHTGRGNYGHDLDKIFDGREGIELVAIADADAKGLEKIGARYPTARTFSDFRQMLDQEKPELVSVAPRHSDQHHAMVLAALQAGSHVYCEKPFTSTLVEADELLAEAEKRGLRIGVAHQMRMQPPVVWLKKAWEEGRFGDLISMESWGKQDPRAGGEDMMVLGTHLFDLMRLFAGDAVSCSAEVLQKGKPVTKEDARLVKDNVGLVAGDEVFASYRFSSGVHGTFISHAGLRDYSGHWGLELRGTKGAARITTDIPCQVFVQERGKWDPNGRTTKWQLPAELSPITPEQRKAGPVEANRIMVDDWLNAIAEKRDPQCSGRDGMRAVEMVMAAYQSSMKGTRVTLPLEERAHPLA